MSKPLVVEVSSGTLPLCVGFLAARADKVLGGCQFMNRALSKMQSPGGFDLVFLRTLEEDISAAYRKQHKLNPPTAKAFLEGAA